MFGTTLKKQDFSTFFSRHLASIPIILITGVHLRNSAVTLVFRCTLIFSVYATMASRPTTTHTQQAYLARGKKANNSSANRTSPKTFSLLSTREARSTAAKIAAFRLSVPCSALQTATTHRARAAKGVAGVLCDHAQSLDIIQVQPFCY